MKILYFLAIIFFVIPFLLRTLLRFIFGTSEPKNRSSQQNKSSSSSRTQKPSGKKKVISKNEGEYVDYEVIKD